MNPMICEAGNSPRIVFANYRELVRPAVAQEWYAIMPSGADVAKAAAVDPPKAEERPENVVDIPKVEVRLPHSAQEPEARLARASL